MKRALHVFAFVLLFALLVGGIFSLKGHNPEVIAQGAPHIDEVTAQLNASPGFINSYTTEDGKLAWEITEDHFGEDFLVVVQMAEGIGDSPLLTGYPLDSDMMTFRMRNEKIELITRNPYFRADPGTPLARMVDMGFQESVYAAFPIIARDNDAGRYLIDVTSLFVNDWVGFRVALPSLYGVGFGLDFSRSTLTSVKAFPENVEVKVELSFATAAPIPSLALPDENTMPIHVHYSVLKLPDEPMKPRLADDRVGFFSSAYKDFSKQAGPTNTVHIVNRWRLEKKDPYAAISDPVEPIIYYIEDTIPEVLRPYVKEGVEAWQPAFEAAGFSNAIIAMDQPDDPDWDPGDARYSTIRWMPSITSVFAIGPSDVDPRSGEILNSDILFASDWVSSLSGQSNLLVESPLDFVKREKEAFEIANVFNPKYTEYLCSVASGAIPHANLLRYTLMADGVISEAGEVPWDYVGEAIRETVMHEVGHGIGLRHNFKASTAVPNDRLHDTTYTRANGVTGSVMEYNPPNIAADRSEQGDYYNHVVGPYDKWAIQWGYLPVGNETLDPHPQLTAIAEELGKPGHEYGTDEDAWIYQYAIDPYITQWDLGSDPIAYYRNQQDLVARLWDGLEDRVVVDGGELWPLRNALHSLLWSHSQGYVYHVKALGGVHVTRAHADDPSGLTPFKVVDPNEQRRALDFVLEAFDSSVLADFPKELLDVSPPERHWDWGTTFAPGSARFNYPLHDIMTGLRTLILDFTFMPERLARIRDNAYRTADMNPFTLSDLYDGFTEKIFENVLAGRADDDSFQRAVQIEYLYRLIYQATGSLAVSGRMMETAEDIIGLHPSPSGATPGVNDARALAFAELQRVHDSINDLLANPTIDEINRAHLMFMVSLLDSIDYFGESN